MVEQVIDAVEADLLDEVAQARAWSATEQVADLTGGKDTRLLLALLLSVGTDGIRFETVGPSSMPDVVAAERLADRWGLDHRTVFLERQPDRPFADRVRDFIARTEGMGSLWEMANARSDEAMVRLTGHGGEYMRHVHQPPATLDDVRTVFRPGVKWGRAGLLTPDARCELEQTIAARIAAAPAELHPETVLYDLEYESRARYRFGPLGRLGGELRISPLVTMVAARGAMTLGSGHRTTETLNRRLIERLVPDLADEPLAADRWPGQATSTEVVAERQQPSLMARIHHSTFAARRDVLAEVLADRTNPAWDRIDRQRTAALLDRAPDIERTQMAEIYGAISAAIWLAGT